MSSSTSTLSSIPSHPLFSTLLTFFALVLLYFPRLLWTSLLSPAFLLAGFLFLSLLRLAATQRQALTTDHQPHTLSQAHEPNLQLQPISNHVLLITEGSELGCTAAIPSSASFEKTFIQWNVRAPLEVIYEDYEEEEDEEEGEDDDKEDPEPGQVLRIGSIGRYPSLSLYYPETDSDSSSGGGWESVDEMENVCFMWDEEDDEKDELIEIALDKKKASELFQLEEDNLIEIDISPTAFPKFNSI